MEEEIVKKPVDLQQYRSPFIKKSYLRKIILYTTVLVIIALLMKNKMYQPKKQVKSSVNEIENVKIEMK
jgi:hypothetical protein